MPFSNVSFSTRRKSQRLYWAKFAGFSLVVVALFSGFLAFPATGYSAVGQAGAVDPTFPSGAGPNATVYDVKVQSDGKILIGGSFTTYGQSAVGGITRLNPDGTLDTTFNPGGVGLNSGFVVMALQADGKIMLGGYFNSYNGTPINRIARLNSNGTLDTTFNPGTSASSTVQAITIQTDGKILIGGDFITYNGTVSSRIARLNPDGTLDTTFNPGAGVNSTVYALAVQPDGKILIGGNFTTYNGTSMNRLARLNSDGTLDSTFNIGTGASSFVYTLVLQPDGKIVIGGTFNNYNGTTRSKLARLNSDGSLDTTFNGLASGNGLNSLVLQPDGKIVIGGNFTTYGGTARNNLARVNSDGTLDTTFDIGSGADSTVYRTVLQPDGKVLIGGLFNSYNSNTINSVARINSDGAFDTSFNPGLTGANSSLRALVVQPDNKILIGGFFTSYGRTAARYLARLNSDGTLDTTFNSGGTGSSDVIFGIATQADGKILIGGFFTSYNGTAAGKIARLNSDGTLDTTFNSTTGANLSVHVLAVQPDGKILIGGNFTTYNGTDRNRIARLNSDGTLDTTFTPGTSLDSSIHALSILPDGKILVGGDFTTYNGTTINRIARLNSDGTLDTTFTPGTGTDDTVQTITVLGNGKLLLGGSFTTYNGAAKGALVQLNSNGTLDTTFNPSGAGPNTTVYAIGVQTDGKLLVGGTFNRYNGVFVNRIIRLNSNGTFDTTFNNTTNGPSNAVYVLGFQTDGKVVIGGAFSSIDTFTRDKVARLETAFSSALTLNSSPNPSDFGQNVTFTATVTPITATGVVTFSDGAITLGTANLTNGVATYATSTLVIGTHIITAQYGGDANFSPTASNPVTQVVGGSKIKFSSADYTVRETVGTAIFTVTRTGSFFGKAAAQIQLIDQTTNINDYLIPLVGSLDTTFGDAGVVGNRVRRIIVQPDAKIIIAGTFSQVGGQPHSSITRLNPDATLDTSFNPTAGVTNAGLPGTIYEIALQPDGKIIVAGIFDKANGQTHNNIARFNPDGTLDTTFNLDINATVLGLHLQPSGKILVGGEFTQVNGEARTRIARLNPDGSLDNTFSPTASADAVVRTFVTLPDAKILVGGEFTQVNGEARTRFARLNPDGTLDTSFTDLALNGNVFRAAGLPSGKVLLGGTFTQAGGQTHNRLAQLNTDGTLDTTFTAGTNDYVAELEVTRSGKLVILGLFTEVNGVPRGGVAQLYPDGMLDTSYTDLGLGGQAFALGIQPNDAIVIGGEFTQVIGFPRHLVARVYGNFGEVSWADGEGGDRFVRIPIVNDGVNESNETFVLTVTNPINLAPIAPSSAVVTIVDSNNMLTVTQPTDDGSGQVANSLSWALLQPLVTGQDIVILFSVPGNQISVSGALPVVKAGLSIEGGVSGVVIDGNGIAGDGLRLSGNNRLTGLTIRHFAGHQLVTLGMSNKLFGVRLES